MKSIIVAMCTCIASALGSYAMAATPEKQRPIDESKKAPVVEEKVVVDTIWPGVPVRYCLYTHGDVQYVVYYDGDRNMAIAKRKLSEKTFTKQVLPSKQGWDSHNYITMAVDQDGCIHVSGNMHGRPLIYFRSEKPGDITTMKRVKAMVGKAENRMTYPEFMKAPQGNLLFKYRHGGSGNGIWYYNIYDAKTKTWKRFLEKPLFGGKGRNAYGTAPRLGPDGLYHVYWMWRERGDCSTNHDISYARSKDMQHWETAAGKRLELPITFADRETIVDPVPVKGGLLNMGNGFGFDSKKQPILTYHRYDKAGHNQIYAARFESGEWVVHQLTDWTYRWHFSGGGSITCQVSAGGVKPHGSGKLAVPYRHVKHGKGLLIVDEETMKVLGTETQAPQYPETLTALASKFPEMQVNWFWDIGTSPDEDAKYVLRWETLGRNRDRPRKGKLPENGNLVVYKLGK